MKSAFINVELLVVIFGLLNSMPVYAQSPRFSELANSEFRNNCPTSETTVLLQEELLFQRATQTYLGNATH